MATRCWVCGDVLAGPCMAFDGRPLLHAPCWEALQHCCLCGHAPDGTYCAECDPNYQAIAAMLAELEQAS